MIITPPVFDTVERILNHLLSIDRYTRFLPLLGLSFETKDMLQGLHEAGDKGRSMTKECKEVYSGCNFSIRDTFLKPVKHEQSL